MYVPTKHSKAVVVQELPHAAMGTSTVETEDTSHGC